jgi:threonine/homoserine/homoserine lactone efflux protein
MGFGAGLRYGCSAIVGVVRPSLAAFVPVALLLIIAPGPDVLLVIRNATRGRGAGVATAVGTVTGLFVHATAATIGLSALVAASAEAFLVVKAIGAVYLVLLGGHALWSSRQAAPMQQKHRRVTSSPSVRTPIRAQAALRQGALTNVLNPKVAVFFVAFLPQFIPAGSSTVASTVLLAAVFVTMTAGYLLLLVALTVHAAGLLNRPVVRRWLDRLAGAVFIGFGVRLATTNR